MHPWTVNQQKFPNFQILALMKSNCLNHKASQNIPYKHPQNQVPNTQNGMNEAELTVGACPHGCHNKNKKSLQKIFEQVYGRNIN